MRFTARPSSRSRDTPGCECWGAGVGGGQPAVWSGSPSPGSLPRRELCVRGWSFLSLLTGFLPPSTMLMPYVTQFLQDAGRSQGACGRGSQARSRQGGEGFEDAADHSLILSAELARSSQKHLQQTVKYGGRRRLPPPGEMKAFLVLGVQAAGILGLPQGVGGARVFGVD